MKIFLGLLLVLILVSGGLTGCAGAEFEVSQLTITPSQVATGEDFTVSAEITNVGDADGIYTATLTVNNIERATRDITVAAGMTEMVSFTLTEESSGSYNIALNDLTGSFEVLKLPSAQEIVSGVIEALDDISSYQFDMDMTMEAAGEADGEAFEMTVTMGISGALDVENRQVGLDMTMNTALPGEDEMDMAMEMYLIGNMAYMMMDEPETGPMWMKQEISETDWEELSEQLSEQIAMTEPQIELLQTAQVKVIGSEKVKGVDCYVLQLTPDMEQLWQTVMQQAQVTGEEILPEVEEEFLQEMFHSFSVKQWVAKDTYFLTKAEIDMAMEWTPEAMGFPEEEGEMTMNITTSYVTYNHNQPISIVVPPEAEEATGIGAGEEEAAEVELANVQTAVYAMMVDNELAWLPNPVTVATNDMSAFPDATSVCGIDKLTDYYGNPYKVNFDKDGYVLYQHDITGDGAQIGLVNYLASQYTTYWYYIDAAGTVTQVPNQAPETAPDVVQEKVKDIESIMGRAEGLGIHVEAIAHEGESMTITCQADDYTTFRDYVIALEEGGRFSMVTPPAESFSYITSGTIELEPKYQYIDMPAVYYENSLALAPMTDSDAIAILVGIAEGSGIDIDPNAGKLRIPSAFIRQVKAAGNTYQVLSFWNIQLQGDYEDVMAFISDIDSRKTLKTMILKRVVISQVDVYGKTETTATVDVDIYTTES